MVLDCCLVFEVWCLLRWIAVVWVVCSLLIVACGVASCYCWFVVGLFVTCLLFVLIVTYWIPCFLLVRFECGWRLLHLNCWYFGFCLHGLLPIALWV